MTESDSSHQLETFHQLFKDYCIFLKVADKDSHVLDQLIPKAFFESNAKLIRDSFLEFTDNKQDFETVTINQRINSNYYKSVYALYHDIKVASCAKISDVDRNANEYDAIDRFYNCAIDVLLRETYRLLLVFQEPQHERLEKLTNLERIVSQEFYKITSSYESPVGESITVLAVNNLPLFSSLNNKSILDDREALVDHPFSLTKIMPLQKSAVPDNLAFISPINPKLPGPIPFELLTQYFHPNWFGLPLGHWLRYSNTEEYTFAPFVDEEHSVVSSEMKGLTWLEQVGFKKYVDTKKAYEESLLTVINKKEGETGDEEEKTNDEEGEDEAEEVVEDEKTEDEEGAEENGESNNAKENTESGTDKQEEENTEDTPLLDLENILCWSPDNDISDDEINAIKNNNAQKYISRLLIDLNFKRRERYLKSNIIPGQKQQSQNGSHVALGVTKPGKEEKLMFIKLRRLLTGLIMSSDLRPKDLGIGISSKIPVSQFVYNGTLPAPPVSHNVVGRPESRASGTRSTRRKR